MNAFQIITVIISALGLLISIIVVYIRTQIDITKLQRDIMYVNKDLDRKEFAITKLEKENKEDHNKILEKIELLIIKINHNGK
jgi:hypothetical protein